MATNLFSWVCHLIHVFHVLRLRCLARGGAHPVLHLRGNLISRRWQRQGISHNKIFYTFLRTKFLHIMDLKCFLSCPKYNPCPMEGGYKVVVAFTSYRGHERRNQLRALELLIRRIRKAKEREIKKWFRVRRRFCSPTNFTSSEAVLSSLYHISITMLPST